MKSVKGKALRGKLVSLAILGLLFFLHPSPFTLHPIFAADSTPSSDIKSKLEELKKEIASKAAALKQDIDRKLTNKAYIGKIKTKSPTAITLATKNGPKIVNINQDTQFDSNVKGKKYSQKLMSEEDLVAGLGDIDENQVLTAKKIVLLYPIPYTLYPKIYLWGQIISISDKLVTLKDPKSKNVAVSMPLNKVKLNDFVILTGNMGKNDIFEAQFVYIIQQRGFIKPKKMVYPAPNGAGATPSATPSVR